MLYRLALPLLLSLVSLNWGLTGCAKKEERQSSRIHFSSQALQKFVASAAFPEGQQICFGAHITFEEPEGVTSNQCRPTLQRFAGFVSQDQAISLSVPKGDQRTIEVYAHLADLEAGATCPNWDDEIDYSRVFLVGKTKPIDLVLAEQRVEVPVQFPGVENSLKNQLGLADCSNEAPACDHDLAGADMITSDGDVLTGSYCNVGQFRVPVGTTISTGLLEKVSVQAENIDIAGTLDAEGKGYAGGEGPGAGVTTGQGGSHAGPGGQGVPAGTSVGVANDPTEFGSGGAGVGANGGGFILLNASANLEITGTIIADGLSPDSCGTGGGGAGGSIVLTADHLTGTGLVRAKGAAGCSGAGGGSGGRIAIRHQTADSSLAVDVGQVFMTGAGDYGAAGSVFVDDASLSLRSVTYQGSFATDNGNPLSFSENLDTVVIGTGAYLHLNSGTIDEFDIEVDGGRAHFQGTTVLNSQVTLLQGEMKLNGSATLNALDINGGTAWVGGTNLTFGDLNIFGGVLTHGQNEATHAHSAVINATNVFIGASGKIDVNGKGFASTHGPGGGATSYIGGSHGGAGGGGLAPYGNATAPITLGSGGYGSAGTGLSGAGGGAVKLTVANTLTIDGSIEANGNSIGCCVWSGAGAGGSIWITTDTLTGTGQILANGGSSDTRNGGGGGRISTTSVTNTFGGTISAAGGTGSLSGGDDGTLYDPNL